MVTTHNLGFPRIGAKRELKRALEAYWKGEIDQHALESAGRLIRFDNWQKQIKANHDFLSVGDFSWYDHVLDHSVLLGVIPERFVTNEETDSLNTYFRIARGKDARASEMTKWFDTNYHYIVPEFEKNQRFKISHDKLFTEIEEAQKHGKPVKPILLGPLSYLWLGKAKNNLDKLEFLKNLQATYLEILTKIKALGVQWVQIDEPILVLDLNHDWQQAFQSTYETLQIPDFNILLTTYFGGLDENTTLAAQLPVAGLHIDIVRAPEQLSKVLKVFPANKILSVGIVDGRNIWRTDYRRALNILKPLHNQLLDRLWIGSSCSLLHSPVDLQHETQLGEVKNWLSFATQKLSEINILARALNEGEKSVASLLEENHLSIESRRKSPRIHNEKVQESCHNVTNDLSQRKNPYAIRKIKQQNALQLPILPTTTIGSFPQTQQIRGARLALKTKQIDEATYQQKIRDEIATAVRIQENLGLDVLVHGEAERNDMVEYFGELLEGFAFTENGWVQSYGSRCVKPPIIYGDVNRPCAMTTEWISYAQSLTKKPVKGMLTGPITILCWSFVRNDQSRFTTAKQIALALRDEVTDLVASGTQVIQIDEPAFREGLPLKRKDWDKYLNGAVLCFKLASCGVPDDVQIHTHMCYSEFNDIIEAIADLDADVITIETSRSDMELLEAFEKFHYPNEIGPGVYDIHSPRIPTVTDIVHLIEKAAQSIPPNQLWINPDCGLKTRDWKETELALANMIAATKILRESFATQSEKSSYETLPS